MRKKILLIFVLLVTSIYSQQASNLFQVITSDLSIQRDPIFRDLQTILEEENAKELKGVDLEILHTIVNEYKQEILQYVQPLKIKGEESSYTLTYRDASLISCKIDEDISLNQLLTELEKKVYDKLNSVLKKASEKYMKNKTAINILFFISYTMLDENKVGSKVYVDAVDYKNLTANLVATKVENTVRNAIISGVSNIEFDAPIKNKIKNIIDDFNSEFEDQANIINNNVVEIFTRIHATIINEVEKPLSQNLKGLTGISASGGTGTFSGGAIYSFSSFDEVARLSVYSNLNFNASDEDSVSHSLLGVRGAIIITKVQIDFLASLYYGDDTYKKFKVYEFGLGLNYNFTSDAVIGVAGFYTHNYENTKLDTYSLGIMFKVSPSSPAIILGYSSMNNSNDKKPIIQINYPININL